MDQTAIVSLLAIGLSLATVAVVRLKSKAEPDAGPFGDVPHVHPEMLGRVTVPSGGSGGTATEQAGHRRNTRTSRTKVQRHIAHDGGVIK